MSAAEHPNSLKTHCPHGHPYAGDNLYVDPSGYRRCRACKDIARAVASGVTQPGYQLSPSLGGRLHGQGRGSNNRVKTHCPKGHPYTGDNLYVDPKGNRRCRACKSLGA